MGNNTDARVNALARNSASVIDRAESVRTAAGHIPRRPIVNSAPHPTFLYIGTPKAGSTWVYDALCEHPDVFVPGKDLQFFDYNYDRGWEWYLRQFGHSGSASAVGEVSHDYYLNKEAAQRIRTDLPDVRLICCLREPGEFAVSLLRWLHSHTRRFGSTFEEIAEHPYFTRVLAYRNNLEAYFNRFPRDQILVLYYEQLKSDPLSFLRELYQFIGVDASYQPAVLTRRSNPTRPPRNRSFLIFVCEVAQLIRKMGGDKLVDAIRWRPTFDRFLYRIFYAADRGEDPAATAELDRIAERVRQEAAGDFDALARLIGKPLPAQWLRAAHRRS